MDGGVPEARVAPFLGFPWFVLSRISSTVAMGIEELWPGRGAFFSMPATWWLTNLARHKGTVFFDASKSAAIFSFRWPAPASTILTRIIPPHRRAATARPALQRLRRS